MKSKTLLWIVVVIIVVALIILPTFTPEDLVTTVPIFGAVGWKKFSIIATITLLTLGAAILIAYNNQEIKDFLKRNNIISL